MITEEALAAHVRATLAGTGTITEIRMFGGLGFMLNGNMVAAVSKRGLLLRVGRDSYAAALGRLGARPMEMRGRPLQGYVRVDPAELTKASLKAWLREAAAFVATLPPKSAGRRVRGKQV